MASQRCTLICGATGSIGSAVARTLAMKANNELILLSRDQRRLDFLKMNLGEQIRKICSFFPADVTEPDSFGKVSREVGSTKTHTSFKGLDGIVYAVGYGPRGGHDNAIKEPLSTIDLNSLTRELEMHVNGLFIVFQEFLPTLVQNGSIVVVSSAITRLTDKTCPSWLYAGYYAAAKAAQDELIRWMRRDPAVQVKNIKVHRIAPAAVDTLFHEGCKMSPPDLIPLETVVEEIIEALESSDVVDKLLLPDTTISQ